MNTSRRAGFTFVELLVSVALVAIFLPAIYKVLSFSLMESRQGEQFTQAWALARQGMEKVMADKQIWEWSVSSPSITAYTDSIPPFTRITNIGEVERDMNGEINPGSVDYETRLVTVTVTWSEHADTQYATLSAYVTKH